MRAFEIVQNQTSRKCQTPPNLVELEQELNQSMRTILECMITLGFIKTEMLFDEVFLNCVYASSNNYQTWTWPMEAKTLTHLERELRQCGSKLVDWSKVYKTKPQRRVSGMQFHLMNVALEEFHQIKKGNAQLMELIDPVVADASPRMLKVRSHQLEM